MEHFANVFCYICNERILPTELFCNITLDSDRLSDKLGFFALIDLTLIDSNSGKLTHSKTPPMACDSKNVSLST
jgi:hypothetical protein